MVWIRSICRSQRCHQATLLSGLMPKYTRLLAALIVTILAAGCGDGSAATVEVSARVTACPAEQSGPLLCYALLIPEASVSLQDMQSHELASGVTDDAGRVVMTISQGGRVRVVISSPMIAGGRREITIDLSTGSTASATVDAPIALLS
jgi:hypothetical protein